MTSIISVVLGLLVLGILVFIHEFGHFIAAKLCGFKVLAFSIGFGTPLVKRTVKGTEYRIGSIPFGGYVKMAGENPEEVREGASAPDDFLEKPVWQRAIVAIAGPLFNYVSAFLMLWLMFVAGSERPAYYERPVIGAVGDSSAAESAGLRAGDSVVAIDGRKVDDWEGVESAFTRQNREYTVTYVRDGVQSTTTLRMKPSEGASLPQDPTGGLYAPLPAVVAEVLPGSPAESAGLQKGDTVSRIDGEKIHSWFELVSTIEKGGRSGDSAMNFVVLRKGGEKELPLLPRYDSTARRYLIGVKVGEGEVDLIRYPAGQALGKALDKGWEYTTMIFDVLGKLLSREVSTDQLSGPLGIIPASGFMMLQGLAPILNFMALIGINLGVLNLLPLVITDGGLLLFLLIELIRGRPLSIKTQTVINKIAIAFFLALFLYISFNDIKRMPEYFRIFGK